MADLLVAATAVAAKLPLYTRADDRAAALHEAKRMLARYADLPFYGNMLAASGFAPEVDAVRAAWRARDVAAADRALAAFGGA